MDGQIDETVTARRRALQEGIAHFDIDPADTWVEWSMRTSILAVVLCVALAFGLTALVWVRLSVANIRVDELARLAERLIGASVGQENAATVGNAELGWSWHKGLLVRLDHVRVGGPGSTVALNVATADMALNTWSLIGGRLVPATIDLERAELDLGMIALTPAVSSDVTSSNDLDQADLQALVAGRLAHIEQQFSASVRTISGEGISSISIAHAHVSATIDRGQGKTQRVGLSDLQLIGRFNSRGSDQVDVQLRPETGAAGWSLRLNHSASPDGKARTLALGVKGLRAADLGLGDRLPGGYDSGGDAQVRLTFTATGALGEASLIVDGSRPADTNGVPPAVKATPHIVATPRPDGTDRFDWAGLSAVWRIARKDVVFERISARFGTSRFAIKGEAVPLGGSHDRIWQVHLASETGMVEPGPAVGPPVKLDRGHLDGRYDVRTDEFTIDAAALTFENTEITASGRIKSVFDAPSIEATVANTSIDTRLAARLWPPMLAEAARVWFVDRIRTGRLINTRACIGRDCAMGKQARPGDPVVLDGRFEGVSARLIDGAVPLADASGQVEFRTQTLSIIADKASIEPAGSPKLSVTALTFGVRDLQTSGPSATIEGRMVGPVEGFVRLGREPAFPSMLRPAFAPDGITGEADVMLKVSLPLIEPPDFARAVWQVDAQLKDFGSKLPIEGRHISAGNLQVAMHQTGLTINGKATIDGHPTDVDLTRTSADATARREGLTTLHLGAGDLVAYGLPRSDMLTGTLQVDVHETPGSADQRVTIDMNDAGIVLLVAGYRKAAGEPAKAEFRYTPAPDGARISDLVLTGPGLDVTGALELDSQGRIRQSRLRLSRLGSIDDGRLSIERTSQTRVDLVLDAARYDARLLNAEPHAAAARSLALMHGPDSLRLAARVGTLTLPHGEYLSGLRLQGTIRNGAIEGQLRAVHPGGAPFFALLRQTSAGESAADLHSHDAGACFRIVSGSRAMSDGEVSAHVALHRDGILTGAIDVTDFALSVAGAGPRQPPSRFHRAEVSLRIERGRVQLIDGAAAGPSVGSTFEGVIDLDHGSLSLVGTFIPLFPPNNAFGLIPIIGYVTGGGPHEGLVGLTWRLSGAIESPKLEVNPLSALAPGMVRKILQFTPTTIGTPTISVLRRRLSDARQ